MFMVTMFHTGNGCKLTRKTFISLADAEEYCDYHYNLGWTIWELCTADTTLSDMLEACG